MSKELKKVLIIGAGLAGVEAAYFLAKRKVSVVLLESKKISPNPSQKLSSFAELVCSNSLKSQDPLTAHGLLKEELACFDSLILKVAEQTQVRAGSSLAVDRVLFSQTIEKLIKQEPSIECFDEIVTSPPKAMKKYHCDFALVAAGPLALEGLESWMRLELGDDNLYFYDAISPIVDAETLDYSKLYYKDRYEKNLTQNSHENADYLNASLSKEEYETFVEELIHAKKTPSRDFEEERFFESCLPIDLMAQRGKDTLRFSCMRPKGLEKEDGQMPYAVLQLRRENLLGDAFNLVGFQTRLIRQEQKRIFSLLPGFEKAEFLSFGSVHRNTFLNAKVSLNSALESKKHPHIFFAGQMVGVEGYTESALTGLYVGLQIYRKIQGKDYLLFPQETCIGALIYYLMTNETRSPSNMNFGILPSIAYDKALFLRYDKSKRKAKKMIQKEKATKAIEELKSIIEEGLEK